MCIILFLRFISSAFQVIGMTTKILVGDLKNYLRNSLETFMLRRIAHAYCGVRRRRIWMTEQFHDANSGLRAFQQEVIHIPNAGVIEILYAIWCRRHLTLSLIDYLFQALSLLFWCVPYNTLRFMYVIVHLFIVKTLL